MSTPAYGSVVYNRERWCRAATKILLDHGLPAKAKELEWLYNGIIGRCVYLNLDGEETQRWLRRSLDFLDYAGDELFPAPEGATPRRDRRKGLTRERAIELSSALQFLGMSAREEVARADTAANKALPTVGT